MCTCADSPLAKGAQAHRGLYQSKIISEESPGAASPLRQRYAVALLKTCIPG